MWIFAFLAPVWANVVVGSLADNLAGRETVDTTLIYASITPVCSVDTAQEQAQVSLDTAADQVVGGITYTCNVRGGFTRRVSSQNGGSLRRGGQSIAYFMSQTGDGGLAIPRTRLTAPLVDEVAAFSGLAVGSSGLLSVQIPSTARNLVAGEYRDTVTIEITPN